MQDNQDIIYGIHPVMEALKSKKRNVTQLYVSDSKAGHRTVEEIIRLAKRTRATRCRYVFQSYHSIYKQCHPDG